jgi:arginase family enzyme
MRDDPNWPRASAWLAGRHHEGAKAALAVLGVPLRLGSITTGRCDLAPGAIRDVLHRYSTWDFDAGVDLLELAATDIGDLPLADALPGDAFAQVARDARALLAKHAAIVLLGGDNSVTRPGVHALGLPLERCALLTLDAHLDLRSLDEGLTNGNPVRALLDDGLPGDHIVQIGIQSFANSPAYAAAAREAGITVVTAETVCEKSISTVISDSLARLAEKAEAIYVDLDLDVMDRAFAPGTPGSRPGGLTPADTRRAAHLCGRNPKVRILDLVELDPTKDISEITALAGAACLLSFASGIVCRSHPDQPR